MLILILVGGDIGQTLEIDDVVLHPNYEQKAYSDIAVLKLKPNKSKSTFYTFSDNCLKYSEYTTGMPQWISIDRCNILVFSPFIKWMFHFSINFLFFLYFQAILDWIKEFLWLKSNFFE